MCRGTVLSVTIAVLISSVALAGIGQFQSWDKSLDKQANLGSWAQFKGNVKDQSDWDVPIAWGVQHRAAGLAQGGNIIGLGAPVAVGQHIEGSAQQGQLIAGGVGPKIQGQSLGVTASQGIVKGIGLGSASAGQIAVLSESHSGGNAAGVMSESSTIIAGQQANVSGLAGALVGGSIGVTSTQSQIDF
jgi:hypothetical protein